MSREDEICWYHSKISRENAEQILLDDASEDGMFLVRDSNTSTGDFVLSVLHEKQVVHYQIRKYGQDAFFSIDEHTTSHGLDSLIEYYQEDAHGLVTKLTKPCKCEAPPHDSRRHGRTNLLHRATKEGNYIVVSELVKCGYKLEAKNQDGQTAVHLASRMGKDDILKKLIDNGANVNCRDTAGYTPLHYACQNNFASTARLLMQFGGANIQARNTETSWVPLHEAASRGYIQVVKVLLSLNVPLRPRTATNTVPCTLARDAGYVECAELLERYECPAPRTHRALWYHGTLGRNEAVTLIQQNKHDASYLVRFSDRNGGCYVLTLLHEQHPYHFLIRSEGKYLFIDDGPYLDSLEHIVDYYSYMADGLPCTLKFAVPPRPKPPVPEFSTMPRQHNRQTNHNMNNNNININKITTKEIPITLNTEEQQPEEMYIPTDQLELGNVLGEGEFGAVIKGSYCNRDVAVKTLHKEHAETNRDAFLSEARVMMKLDHHCIVRLIGICTTPTLRMVQELVQLGSMLAYLIDHPNQVSPDYELKVWAAQIACGMKYLEQQRFVHRDLAARNILLASRHQAKISDFGLSRALGTDHEYYRAMQGGKWPLRWYAPESFNYGTFSHASDVWSFGVTLWEMFTFGEQPYGNRKGTEVIQAIDKGERLEQPEQCPAHIYAIMERCWAYQANDRPTFDQLLQIFSSDTEYINIQELVAETNLN